MKMKGKDGGDKLFDLLLPPLPPPSSVAPSPLRCHSTSTSTSCVAKQADYTDRKAPLELHAKEIVDEIRSNVLRKRLARAR